MMEQKKRLIDANRIVEVAERAYSAWNLAMATADGKREINLVYKRQELCKAVKAVADDCPTVDAVEVVRCKNCKFFDSTDGFSGYVCRKHCGMALVTKETFCSCGERKECTERDRKG